MFLLKKYYICSLLNFKNIAMKKNKFLPIFKTSLASLLFLFFTFCSKNEPSETEIEKNKVKSILEKYQKNLKRGGIVLSYQKKGKEVQNVAVGFSDNEKKKPITPEMYFVIASNTKTYVASLIMLLKEQNKLKLSDPIKKFITKRYTNISPEIKINQLLNHSSGLADYVTKDTTKKILMGPSTTYTKEQILNISAPKFAPGTNVAYSNTNYLLLGMIVEAASGKKYKAFLKEQILDKIPLKAVFEGNAIKNKMANSYLFNEEQIIPVGDMDRSGLASVTWATGDLAMPPSEMVIFYRALFEGKVVPKNSLEEMKNPSEKEEKGIFYGYGLQKRNYKDLTFYGHGGTSIAFTSLTAYEPKTETILCIYLNSAPHYETKTVEKIAKEIFINLSN